MYAIRSYYEKIFFLAFYIDIKAAGVFTSQSFIVVIQIKEETVKI